MKRIAVIVAMREEESFLLPALRGRGRDADARNGVRLYLSGVGSDRAESATVQAIEGYRPDLIVSAGFGGAVTENLRVGDVVRTGAVYRLEGSTLDRLGGIRDPGIREPERMAAVVSTPAIETKSVMRRICAAESTVVADMETAAVAGVAARYGIAFHGVRAISDGPFDEIPFSGTEILGPDGQVSAMRVLLLCLRKPSVAAALPRLYSSSAAAGRSLASWFSGFLAAGKSSG